MRGNRFSQVIIQDVTQLGAASLWYTRPPAIAVGLTIISEAIDYSSLRHELGHNFSLNSPENFIYGGKIDGNANAVYSETVAQILQHATARIIIRSPANCGIPTELSQRIDTSSQTSMRQLDLAYREYRALGMPFAMWNDPSTKHDETRLTFMTLAYIFFYYTDEYRIDTAVATKRFMSLLQKFDESLHQLYAQHQNSVEADAFRSTLMVSAISHAVDTNSRSVFRDLNFPVNDVVYRHLRAIARSTSNEE